MIDLRLLLLCMMNATSESNEEKLTFAFTLYDEEETKMITSQELLLIL